MSNPAGPVTGYPAPNPNGYACHYPTPPPPPPRLTPLRNLIVMSSFVSVIFLVGLLIFYLVMNPHLPTVHLTTLALSNFSTSQTQVTGNWDARFQVYNPSNKMSLSFRDVVSKLFYKSEFLSQTTLPPFEQGKKNLTTLDARFSVMGSYLDRRVVDSINGETTRGGQVRFNLKLDCLVGFRYGAYRTRRRYFTVFCDDLAVNVTASSRGSGNLVGGPRKCEHY